MKNKKGKENKEYEVPEEIEKFAEEISGGYFNTRIIKHITDNGEYYAIHEVHYKKDNAIWGWTEEPINVIFEDKNNFKELVKQIMESATKPILVLNQYSDKLEETNEIWISLNKKGVE